MEKLSKGFIVLALMVCLTAGIANAADVTSGLVAHWPLDGNADDVVSGNNGELMGGPIWVAGRVEEAIELDGTQHVNVPDFNLITDTITFVAWINGWKVVAWAGIVGSRTPNACEMIFGDNDFVHYAWNDDAENTWRWDGAPTIPQNEWAMIALAVEPDKATAYVYSDVDGLQQGSNDIPHIEQTVGVLNIGWADCADGQRYFIGKIDEVMIYDRALTAEDILQLATSGLAISEPDGKLTTTWGRIKQ